MDDLKISRNIRLYYWFEIFMEPLFWGPILIAYIQAVSGMSLSRVYLMESICIIGLMALEIPSGAIADMLGRRLTLLLGAIIFFVKMIINASAVNEAMIWLGNILWVIGYSLISGADSSMLYDSLKYLGRESEFKKICGRAAGWRLFCMAVGSLVVGYLAEVNLRLPAAVSCLCLLITIPAAYYFHDPPNLVTKNYRIKDHLELMKKSVMYVVGHSYIKWIILFGALIAVVSKIWFFTYNPYFKLVDLPLRYYGWIFFLMNIVAALSSHQAHHLDRWLGNVGSILLMVIFLGIPILIMSHILVVQSVFLILFANVVRGYIGPFSDHLLHDYLSTSNRATALSVKSAIISLMQVIGLGIFGWLLSRHSLPNCLNVLGWVTLIFGLFFMVFYFRIFKK